MKRLKDQPISKRLFRLPDSVPYRIVTVLLPLLFLILTVVFLVQRPLKNKALYDRHAYIDPGVNMKAIPSSGHKLYVPLSAFEHKDYQQVIHFLENEEYHSAVYKDTAEFYLGAAYLYDGQSDKAITHFDILASDTMSAFQGRAEWLQALALLSSNKERRLSTVLSGILDNTSHAFYDEAIALSRKHWLIRWLMVFSGISIMALISYRLQFFRVDTRPEGG